MIPSANKIPIIIIVSLIPIDSATIIIGAITSEITVS